MTAMSSQNNQEIDKEEIRRKFLQKSRDVATHVAENEEKCTLLSIIYRKKWR